MKTTTPLLSYKEANERIKEILSRKPNLLVPHKCIVANIKVKMLCAVPLTDIDRRKLIRIVTVIETLGDYYDVIAKRPRQFLYSFNSFEYGKMQDAL